MLHRRSSIADDGVAARRARKASTPLIITGDAMGRPLIEALDENPQRYDLVVARSLSSSSAAVFSPTVKDQFLERFPNLVHHRRDRLVRDRASTASRIVRQGPAARAGRPDGACRARHRRARRRHQHRAARAPAWSASWRAAATSRSATTRTRRRPARRSSTAIDGRRYSVAGDFARGRGRRHASRCSAAARSSINSGGEKIFPEEVEAALKAHPTCSTSWSSACPTSVGPAGGRGRRAAATAHDADARRARRALPPGTSPATRCRRELHVVDKIVRSPQRQARLPLGQDLAESGDARVS